jgi:hypothetical protein
MQCLVIMQASHYPGAAMLNCNAMLAKGYAMQLAKCMLAANACMLAMQCYTY